VAKMISHYKPQQQENFFVRNATNFYRLLI
jgi:hypothetical protein